MTCTQSEFDFQAERVVRELNYAVRAAREATQAGDYKTAREWNRKAAALEETRWRLFQQAWGEADMEERL